jgi:tRNA pseudouridine55 synthase
MDGIILVNKEKGMTSRDVVNLVSRVCHTKKVGHTGTLDPMATGLLVICVGRATKLVEVLTSHQKEYIASMMFGMKTDTKDITGTVLEQRISHVTKEQIEIVLHDMTTTYQQEVPIYSAVKIHGKKLYEYARNGEQIELPKREVTIELLKIIDWQDQKQELTFLTQVSKGTYIRSLVEDIATHLDTIGTMTALTRTKVGNFSLEQANTIVEIKNKQFKVYTIYEVLKSMYETRQIAGELEKKVLNGAKIDNPEDLDIVFFINEKKEPLALYRREGNLLKCYKMLKIGID